MDKKSVLDTLKTLIGVPAVIVALLAIGSRTGCWATTGERLIQHEQRSDVKHQQTDTSLHSLREHTRQEQQLLEGIARGECLENPCANLARQGMLPTCNRLGITRCRRWRDST